MGQCTSIELIGLALDGIAALAVGTHAMPAEAERAAREMQDAARSPAQHAASRSSRTLPIVSMVCPKSFALQAGREIRILVQSEQVSENELEDPGQVTVTVISETRAVEIAR